MLANQKGNRLVLNINTVNLNSVLQDRLFCNTLRDLDFTNFYFRCKEMSINFFAKIIVPDKSTFHTKDL